MLYLLWCFAPYLRLFLGAKRLSCRVYCAYASLVLRSYSGRIRLWIERFRNFMEVSWRMPCFRPIPAVRVSENHERFWSKNGKFKLWFGKTAESYLCHPAAELLHLPCGKCVGCLNRRSSDWAVRCYHESMFWDEGSFVTLTYSTPNLPANRSLDKADLQRFWKNFRIRLEREYGVSRIKYFACGEYGEERGRPHYHAVIFGFAFPDRVETKQNAWSKEPLFESEFLTSCWGKGKCTLGITVGGKSANYVAKYALKRAYGEKGKAEYAGTGRVAPFNCMSHGIGARWFAKYKADLYPSDFVVNEDGTKRLPVPRRYDVLLSEISEEYLEWIKSRRVANRKSNPSDETAERIKVRELCAMAASKAASERRLERRVKYRESEIETARLLLPISLGGSKSGEASVLGS